MYFRTLLKFASIMTMATALLCASANASHAQQPVELDSNIQGTVGLGLVGAELGLLIPALAGMEDAWPYIVFPVVGAGGGAVAGYFLLDQPEHTEVGVITLAAGMLLIVPTIVATLALTAYDPESDFPDDDDLQTPGEEGAAEAPAPNVDPDAAEQGAGTTSGELQAGVGLLRVGSNGKLMVGAPGLSIAPVYSLTEQRQFGASAATSLRVPVLSGAF